MKNTGNINKKRNKSKGFTLVELLATLAILSLVTVIVIYTSTNVINNARENSYMVTINNIQKESGTYVLENNKDILWLSDGSDSLYQCVTVQNLIDMGYFDNNILDSKVSKDRNVKSNDYIYIEKDKNTKTITRQVLLYDDNSELRNLCGDYINADGSIVFDIYPSNDIWAKSKEITITYRLDDSVSVGDSDNYIYIYEYDAMNDNSKDEFVKSLNFTTSRVAIKKISVFDEGTVYAYINQQDNARLVNARSDVIKIDTVGPVISEGIDNQIVRGSVTIPINISDGESGIKKSTISVDDFNVSIGTKSLNKGDYSLVEKSCSEGKEINYCNYNLKIENYNYTGEVVIEISAGNILDDVGNKNNETILNTGVVFDNTYKITYNVNNGVGSMSDTICTYSINCTLRDNTFTRLGYTFLGWSTDKNATSVMYENKYVYEPFNLKDDVTLYAVWKANTYTIIYDKNSGTGSMSNTTCTYDSDCTLRSNTFTRTGYTFNGWNTKVDGSGTSYSDKATVKNLTSTSGGSITLYAIWKLNTPPTCTLAVSSSGIKFKTTSSDTISSWLSTKDNATSGKTSLELSEGTKYGFVKNSDGLVGKCSVDIEYSVRNKSYSCTESNYSNPKNSCSSSYPYYYSDTCDVTHKYTAELANCWYDEATRTSTWRSTKKNYLYNQTSCIVKATNGVTSCTYSQFQNNSTIVVGCKISSSTYSGVINCYNIYCSKGYTSISGANYCYK